MALGYIFDLYDAFGAASGVSLRSFWFAGIILMLTEFARRASSHGSFQVFLRFSSLTTTAVLTRNLVVEKEWALTCERVIPTHTPTTEVDIVIDIDSV